MRRSLHLAGRTARFVWRNPNTNHTFTTAQSQTTQCRHTRSCHTTTPPDSNTTSTTASCNANTATSNANTATPNAPPTPNCNTNTQNTTRCSTPQSNISWRVVLVQDPDARLFLDGNPADPVGLASLLEDQINLPFEQTSPLNLTINAHEVVIQRTGENTLEVNVNDSWQDTVHLGPHLMHNSTPPNLTQSSSSSSSSTQSSTSATCNQHHVIGDPTLVIRIQTNRMSIGSYRIRWPRKHLAPSQTKALQILRATKEGDLDSALQHFDQALLTNTPLPPHALSAILFLLAGADNWESVLRKSLRGEQPLPERNKREALRLFSYATAREGGREGGGVLGVAGLTAMARISAHSLPHSLPHSPASLLHWSGIAAHESPPVRHRLFSPALVTYAETKDYGSGLEVLDTMKNRFMLDLGESDIALVIEACIPHAPTQIVEGLLKRLEELETPISYSTATLVHAYFKAFNAANPPENHWKVRWGSVDSHGECSVCSGQLKHLKLSQEQTDDLANLICSLAATYPPTKHKNIGTPPKKEFGSFRRWLSNHGPYQIILDGANIALYGQNYSGGLFRRACFDQLELMIDHLEKTFPDKRRLVVFHNNRLKANPDAQPLVQKLQRENSLYTVRGHDDWFWLYASVAAGKDSLLISNDEMRDHISELAGCRNLQKFKRDHQVRFFMEHGTFKLDLPPPYTPCVQFVESTNSWMLPATKTPTDPVSDQQSPRSRLDWLCISKPSTAQ